MRFSIQNYTRIAKAALTGSVPVYAHFGVTHRCNLTCKMCGIWRYGNANEELSISSVARQNCGSRYGMVMAKIQKSSFSTSNEIS